MENNNLKSGKRKKPHDKVRRIRYEEQEQIRKRKKFNWFRFFKVVLILAIVITTVLFLFYTRKIEMKGLNMTTDKQMNEFISGDIGNKNTLYSYFKMNYFDCDLPPAVESVKVSLKRPWHMVLDVKEKNIEAYVNYKNKYLCFDSDGTAIYISPYPLEECTYIEGMKIDEKSVKLGKILPVDDEDVFEKIVDISRITEKYNLNPDRIVCEKGSINLYFGPVEVMLGKGNYEIRIAQLPPILEEMQENYSDETGTLHLENFNNSDNSVRFVPATYEEEE